MHYIDHAIHNISVPIDGNDPRKETTPESYGKRLFMPDAYKFSRNGTYLIGTVLNKDGTLHGSGHRTSANIPMADIPAYARTAASAALRQRTQDTIAHAVELQAGASEKYLLIDSGDVDG